MRVVSAFAMVALALGMSGSALADGRNMTRVPRTQAISPDVIKAEMNQLGYDVLSVVTDDGYLKAAIVDRNSGGIVKADFDPVTGELLRARPAF